MLGWKRRDRKTRDHVARGRKRGTGKRGTLKVWKALQFSKAKATEQRSRQFMATIRLMCKFRSTFVWLSGMFPAFRCNYYRLTTRRSSPARVAAFPGLPSATGRAPFGRPVSSSRTLTTGLGADGPEPTALCW